MGDLVWLDRRPLRSCVKSYPCQVPLWKLVERSSDPLLLVMVSRTSGWAACDCSWALIMAKTVSTLGVAPFCEVCCTRASWSARPLISPTGEVALAGTGSGTRCRENHEFEDAGILFREKESIFDK